MTILRPTLINQIFKKYLKKAQVPEAILFIEDSKGTFTHQARQGELTIDRPFLAASLTKMFVTCLILQLVEEERLNLADGLVSYFDRGTLEGLHVFEGKDYSFDLTVADLLFQTSGLADSYLEGPSNFSKRLVSEDFSVTNEERIQLTKSLSAHFKPGTTGKAFYADINFNLLGQLLENVLEQPLAILFKERICQPLALSQTYLIEKDSAELPNVYFEQQVLNRPKFLAQDASSGLVTTARDLMIFLKAFYTGQLFDPRIFKRLESYHELQADWAPIRYGAGFMKLPLRKRTKEGLKQVELLGHTGSTGAFAFYYPQGDLFLVGTLQQMARPDLSIRMLMNLVMKL